MFQQKTKAKLLTNHQINPNGATIYTSYIVTCMHYIHQNAWKAGLVKKMEAWNYSSFPDYIGNRNGKICNKELLFNLTGYDANQFYKDKL